METLKRLGGQAGSLLFVEWDGHWYGIPCALADNMRKAGFTVLTKPPEPAHIASSVKTEL